MDKSHSPYSTSSLYKLPIYRLLLDPFSLTRENNSEILPIELIDFLPNSKIVHHKQEMKFRLPEEQAKYYDTHLLFETKVFCREMLQET